jgi:hypothetical protein
MESMEQRVTVTAVMLEVYEKGLRVIADLLDGCVVAGTDVVPTESQSVLRDIADGLAEIRNYDPRS